jgi:hypothetical protein
MKYTGYMFQHFLKSINRPRTKHKISTEGDKLQEGLYRKLKSFRFQPFYPVKHLDIIKTYITMNTISCKIF